MKIFLSLVISTAQMNVLHTFVIAVVIVSVSAVKADCNSTSIGGITTELANPFYTITFDDLGFPSNGWGWTGGSALHITHGPQNITLSGPTCRVWGGPSGFDSTSWNSNAPWSGSTTGKVGDFMIVGDGSNAGYCLFEVSPPISAFTMRLTSRQPTSIQAFDSDGAQIGCVTPLPLASGTNAYYIIGFYSDTPISSFSTVVDSTGIIQADNIQLLTCPAMSPFNGTACVRLQ